VPDYEHCCKVGRVADKHDLSTAVLDMDINKGLLDRWLGRGEYPETAVRPLATWFNQNILKTVYREHGREALEHQLENDYEALTSDENNSQRLSVERSLEEDGIDPEELVGDFISSSTLYRHLTECLDGSKERKEAETDWEKTKVSFAKDKAADQVGDALRSWENKEKLPGATDAEVDVSIHLSCPECSTSVPLSVARQRGYICDEHLGVADNPEDTQ
jgi:hypothetical protein